MGTRQAEKDSLILTQIENAVSTLNNLIAQAVHTGLCVEVDTFDVGVYGLEHEIPQVTVNLSRVTQIKR
jgi:hypothetical protein